MELLARVSMEGSVEAGYLCATLLLCDHEDEEEVQRGVQIMEVIRISGQLESCSKFFRDIFNDIMVFFEICMQMARSSVKNRKKRNAAKKIGEKGTVSVEYKCLLNLLPRDIWVRIATKVASYSIKDLFNMQVFLDAARSDAVYKETSILELPIASFLFYYGCPENRFLECCAAAGNPVALLRVGMTEFVWIGHCIGGIDTQTMATIGGDLEACYIKTKSTCERDLNFLKLYVILGVLERCREVFKQVFAGRWMEVKPLDPGQPEVCRSTSCRTQGTMSDVEDLSRVSCVQCLADYEVRPLQMAGSSKTNRQNGNVPVEHECPLNLLPRDIWATCKVFLDAASSEAVYQHTKMWYILLVSFLFYLDRLERKFLDRCIEAGNTDAIL
ncbi:hypothetical protein Ahy_A09g043638 [Arachis hypogaea]|uniref:At2g35280-like TPR domain-containing protein n=1 Tax=Arachis hypogaea TaxID=3818 RepID=A0A445BIZ7_ARAHY|nr:hypothetical protein Ahy_A09g043638 [Arachis hypogaea]